DKQVAYRVRMEVTGDRGELEAVARGERQHDRVLGGGRLQLEVELGAKTLAQREPPRAVDPAAVGRMNDELHAARFVEKPLEDDALVRRHRAQCGARDGKVVDELRGGALGDSGIGGKAGDGARLTPGVVELCD